MKEEIRLTNPAQIRALADEVRFFGTRPERIIPDFIMLTLEENESLSEKIRRCYAFYHYSQRKVIGLIIFFLYLTFLLSRWSPLPQPGWESVVLTCTGCAMLSLVIIRLYGVHRTRMVLRYMAFNLEKGNYQILKS
ncbi:MAG: hypothetical protein RLP14_09500 [Owenweeksia sp.]